MLLSLLACLGLICAAVMVFDRSTWAGVICVAAAAGVLVFGVNP